MKGREKPTNPSDGSQTPPVLDPRVSASVLRTLLETLPQPVFFKDVEGRYLLVNSNFAQRAGTTPEECLGKTDFDLFSAEEATANRRSDQQFLNGEFDEKTGSDVEKRADIPTSSRTGLRHVVYNGSGPIGILGVDDGEISFSQGAFSSHFLLKAIHEVNLQLIHGGNPKKLAQEVCAILLRHQGFKGSRIVLLDEMGHPELVVGSGNKDALQILSEKAQSGYLPPCCQSSLEQLDTLVITDRTGICLECPVVQSCSKGISLCMSLRLGERKIGFFSASLEPSFAVTDDVKRLFSDLASEIAFALHSLAQENLLAKSKQMLAKMIDHCPALISVIDPQGRFLLANRKLGEVLGEKPEELIGKGQEGFFPAEVIDNLSKNDRLVFSTGQPQFFEEKRPTAHGYHIYFTIKFPLLDTDGKVSAIGAISTDITERLSITRALTRSQGELLAIYDNAPIMMCVMNSRCEVLYSNRSFSEFAGISDKAFNSSGPGQVLGCINAIESPEGCGHGQKCGACPLRNALRETLLTGTSRRRFEFQTTLCWGTQSRDVTLLGSTALIKFLDESNILLCFEDITERKKAEEDRDRARAEFYQSQKMEAFGRLAGGIAHDFNNLLGVILGYSELGVAAISRGKGTSEQLEGIADAAKHAAKLTQQLLTFSRKQALKFQNLRLNSFVNDTQRMLTRVIGEHISIELQLEAEPDWVRIDPGQMSQVLINLAINARDAMPKGGTIRIGTTSTRVEETPFLLASGLNSGDFVCLAFTDTGSGMTKEVQDHLFEPFFTTKQPGKGTGLGLATVFGILKQSQGQIFVESKPGKGTTFRLYLPLVESEKQPRKPDSTVSANDHVQIQGTVLLAEDSPVLRDLLHRFLEKQGYFVLVADNGSTAMELSRKFKGSIDALVSDVVMPVMNGIDLFDALKKERPDTPVIFMSGYSPEDAATIGKRLPKAPFLAKPFNLHDLAQKVREVIKASRSSPERLPEHDRAS